MNRFVASMAVCLSFAVQAMPQTLTEEEVSETMSRALELNKAENYEAALEAFLVVGENTVRQRTAEEHQMYVCSQTMAMACYELTGRYGEGYLLGKKLMAGKLEDNEKKDVYRQFVLNGYLVACGLIKRDKNGKADYAKGREILLELVPYADEEMLGHVMPRIPLTWYFEGLEHFISQRYDEALRCQEHARKGFHEQGLTKNEISATKEIAAIKYHTYDIVGSIKVYNEALLLARQVKDDKKQMAISAELHKLYSEVGDMEQAASFALAMDSLAEATTSMQAKFDYFNQKGKKASSQGVYDLAEQWFLKCKAIAESQDKSEVGANKHLTYSNLRNLYAKARRFDEALEYGRKTIVEYQSLYPATDINYYLPYMDMADIYRLQGDKRRCFECLDTLFLCEPQLDEPRDLCELYIARARGHAAFKDWTSAFADYKKADEVMATKYPETDGYRVMLLPLIGGAEHQLKHYAESEQYYSAYAGQAKLLYGENSIEYIDALIYLANAEGFAGLIEDGCRNYTTAVGKLKDLVRHRLPYMNAIERESFWTPISSSFTLMTPYALQAELFQTEYTRTCYDALLLSKAFLLESERSLYDIVKHEGTDADMRDYMEISAIKNKTKEWEKDYRLFADSIMAASHRVSQLESALSMRCKSYGDMASFMDIDYNAVQGALSEGETLIDFTDFVSETKGRRYAAYIVTKEQQCPLLKPLFAERQMDSLGIVRPDMYYDKDFAPEIIRLLWEPLKGQVAEGSTIYYVPSQLLFRISLESLPLEDGSLLGEHYNFVRLSSARELVKDRRTGLLAGSRSSAVLYGGLQYDLDPKLMAQESRQYDLSSLLVMRGEVARGDSVFCELPGSKDEIAKIEALLRSSKFAVTSYTGMKGTEESFLNMHGRSPQVLHLATHGFYYTPDKAASVDYLKGYTDAMSLSGLVLSGGNAAWRGRELPQGVLGGILTAGNIARLDLSNTEMIVLSACQSGQGHATAEGLYGLQRAFKKAGAGTMVMALWNVSDRVATDFMTAFYERLTAPENHFNKRQAFNEAKAIIRKQYPDPYHWAAFVMLD